MNYRPLGRTGVQVSQLALGTDNFANPTSEAECFAILDAAVEAGVNLVDTSNSYAAGEAERIIGRWLAARGQRDRVFLATKAFYPTGPGPNDRGGSRLHLLRACDDSLRRLQTDHLDLYQTHRPDMDTALEETLRAMDDLVRAGKVRYIGSTTAPAWHVVESVLTSEFKNLVRIVSEQTPYNLLDRRVENELLPACQRHGLAVLTWSPLAMGMLAGRYTSADAPPADSRIALRGGIYAERVTQRGVDVGNAFAALARDAGHDPAQLAVAWVLDRPGVTAPLLGPRTLSQFTRLFPAIDIRFDDALRAACDALAPPGGVIASFFNSAPWMVAKRA
jgi:1-deoxyxylulose-5-phosphate synthase